MLSGRSRATGAGDPSGSDKLRAKRRTRQAILHILYGRCKTGSDGSARGDKIALSKRERGGRSFAHIDTFPRLHHVAPLLIERCGTGIP
jgi:hypothetical protein